MDSRIAPRYARALFAASKKANVLDSVSADLNGIADTLDRDARFRHFVSNPNFSRDQKLNLFETVFSDRVTALTMSMLRLMVQKNREGYITELRERFNELKREHDDVLLIKITSAKPLELEHKTAIISKVEAATKKKVQAVTDVNESLVGGVKVEYGGHVIDGTVTGNLSRLKEKLLYDLLKQN